MSTLHVILTIYGTIAVIGTIFAITVYVTRTDDEEAKDARTFLFISWLWPLWIIRTIRAILHHK